MDLIIPSNQQVKMGKVKRMQNTITLLKAGAFPAWLDPERKKYIITDGNHRLMALKIRGYKVAPIVEITKDEFDHVKFSKRTIDLIVRYPKKINVIKSL